MNDAAKPRKVSAEQVKQARKQAGLTQEAAARMVGVCTGAWRNWEHGKSTMHTVLFLAFKHLTGVEFMPFGSIDQEQLQSFLGPLQKQCEENIKKTRIQQLLNEIEKIKTEDFSGVRQVEVLAKFIKDHSVEQRKNENL